MTEAPNTIKALLANYFHDHPREAARRLNRLPLEQILTTVQENKKEDVARIFAFLDPDVGAALAAEMTNEYFVEIFDQIDPSLAANLLARLDKSQISDRLSLLPKALAAELQELMHYPPETAGALMDVRVPIFSPDDSAENALAKIRGIQDRRVVNLYLVDDERNLVGTVALQQLAVSDLADRLGDLVMTEHHSIPAMAPKEDVVGLFESRKLFSLPVVDFDGKLLGVIRNDALVSAVQQGAMEDVQAMFGAGRDERALSKAPLAIRKRLPWLQINLATAFLAAAVVGLFEDTIAKITALAIFLPVVAGQSGNTGSQALAVTMRGLALREVRPRQWLQIVRKEAAVGFVNGCLVAITTAIVAYIWMGSYGLAVIIAVAMVFSMVIAGISGAVIPIVLKTLGQDPAQSSSIVLTTVTDVVGFMSFLGLATLLSEVLQIG